MLAADNCPELAVVIENADAEIAAAMGAPSWGRDVENSTVNGHPALVYTRRPRAVADFMLSARRWRGREVLVQGERRITVERHEAAVGRVAAHLAARGIAAGSRVVLLGFNSIEWVVTFWAVQTLGAVAVLGNAWWTGDEVGRRARPGRT